MAKMTARETTKLLTSTLLDHHNRKGSRLPWPEWIAVAEIEAKGASGRVDVLAVRRSYSSPEIRVCEVKATRQDFLRDVNAGKYRKYLPICNTLYFCVPSGLVKKHEVPDDAGLMCWSGSRWVTVRRAPRHEGKKFSNKTLLSVAMKAVDRVTQNNDRVEYDRAEMRRLVQDPGFLPGSEYTDDQLAVWAARRAGIVLSQRLAMTPDAESLAKTLVRELQRLPNLSRMTALHLQPEFEDWGDEPARELAKVIGGLRRLEQVLGETDRLKEIGSFLYDLASSRDWELSGERADITMHGSADRDAPLGR